MLSESTVTKSSWSVCCHVSLRSQKNLIVTHQHGVEWKETDFLDLLYSLPAFFIIFNPHDGEHGHR